MKKKVTKYCRDCEHNPEGICELCGKEIPITHVMGKQVYPPKFCPLREEKLK